MRSIDTSIFANVAKEIKQDALFKRVSDVCETLYNFLFDKKEDRRHKLFLAGGSMAKIVRGEITSTDIIFHSSSIAPSDFDFYFYGPESKLEELIDNQRAKVYALSGTKFNKKISYRENRENEMSFYMGLGERSANAWNFKSASVMHDQSYFSYQIIDGFKHPREIKKQFDFIHACCYYDFYKRELHLSDVILDAIENKKLIWTSETQEQKRYEEGKTKRIQKLINQGYRF